MKLLNKIFSFISVLLLLFYQVSVPILVLAQESISESTQSGEITPSPSPSETPAPTIEPTPSPSESPSPTPTPIPTPSDQNNSSTTVDQTGQPNAPNITTETPHGHLSVAIVHRSSTQGVNLDLNPINQTSASLTTDKADYSPTDVVVVSGTNFKPNTTYILIVSSSDPPAVKFETQITTNETGSFIYSYQLDGNYRPNYKVEVKGEGSTSIATTTFTDTAVVTPASGGTAISADKTSAAGGSNTSTALGAITLAEGANGDFQFTALTAVTLILNVPTGFVFDTTSSPNVTFTASSDISSASVTSFTTTALTITVTPPNGNVTNDADTLTVGNVTPLKVKPTTGVAGTTGNITNSGTMAIMGVTQGTTNFGTLTEVIGAVNAGTSTVGASPASVAADGVTTSTITVTLKDQFGNPVSGKTVTLASSRGGTDTISAASGASSSSGVVTFTVKSSTIGTATLTATDTTDANLVITQTATVTFTDTNPPTSPGTPTTTSPTSDNTPTWNWTAATDNVGIDRYIFYWDTVSGGEANNSGNLSSATLSFTHSIALADGTWYGKVKAFDAAGNSAASGNGSVVIDTTGPTLSEITPVTIPTSDNTPNYTFNSNEAGTISYGGDCSSGTSSATSGNNTITFNSLSDGAHSNCTIKVTDSLGNQSSNLNVSSFTVDTISPTAPGTPTTTSPTSDNTPTWNFTASTDGGSGLAATPYSVQWCTDAAFTGCGANTATSNTNSFTHSASLADGTWYFKVKATDAAGNQSSYSSNGSVVVDTAVPGITYNYPTAGGETNWYNSDPGNVIDIDFIWGGGAPLDNAQRKIGSGSFINIFTADRSSDYTSDWDINWSSLSEGLNQISLKVADTAGNVRTDNYEANVSGFLLRKDTVAPTDPTDVASTSHTAGDSSLNKTIGVSWSQAGSAPGAEDETSGVDGYSYSFTSGAEDVPIEEKIAEEDLTSVAGENLADGTWYFHLRTRDNAGNWTSTVHKGPFNLTSEAPAEVFVDDNFSDGSNDGGYSWNYNAFSNIQDAIDTISEGGTVNVASGEYTETIYIDRGLTLTGAGRENTTVFDNDCNGDPTVSIDADNVTIQDFTINNDRCEGSVVWVGDERNGTIIQGNKLINGYYGIELRSGSSDIQILDNTISDSEGSGIYSGNSSISNITTTGNDIQNNSEAGIYHNQVTGTITVSGNTLSNNSSYGMYLGTVSNATVTIGGDGEEDRNTITENGSTGIYLSGGGSSISSSTVTISGNTISSNSGDGIYADVITDSTFSLTDNTIETNNNGIYICAQGECVNSTVTIDGNGINNNNGAGIYLYEILDGSTMTITQNSIQGNGEESFATGIYINYVYNSTLDISTNDILENIGDGIHIIRIEEGGEGGETLVTISDNNVRDNQGYGVYMSEVSNSDVTIGQGNTISNNNNAGIYLNSQVQGVGINGNTITGNGEVAETTGIVVLSASGNEAHENNISGNGSTGVQNNDGTNDFDANENYWGAESGPLHDTTNPEGQGNSVSDNVLYRPFYTDEGRTTLSTNSVDPDDLSSLLDSGSFDIPDGENSESASQLTVNEDLTINVSDSGGTSSVVLPSGTVITNEDGTIDVPDLTSDDVSESSLAGLGAGVVVDGALQWGLDNVELTFSQPITLNIFVGTALNGQTLNIVRSTTGSSGWTADGIVAPATCVVTAGICSFQATKASFYATTHTVSPTPATSSSTSTSGGGGGGGDGLGCASHDCSVHPALQNLVLGISAPASATGFTPGVLGVTSEGNLGIGQGEVKSATVSAEPSVTATAEPQAKTGQSPFNVKTIAIVVIALLLGFGVFKLIIK